ncbi:alpha/beta hydrolase [Singulisphaera acidiphila]|uniref:Esterase/lipase n=1 Tax=Singulisphaera acidiphila (strain ATCC BAA-1392 / DSM 18658 / VKM B-2454 / MOB10) TaxID=886293 RepID=L0DIY3_SINAD|nr:alpha/beta hydrolase [Singulisphaera acidiphila]AGA28805.1 esterase/lipase [Singulisphaera acidiphila DSM 18658]
MNRRLFVLLLVLIAPLAIMAAPAATRGDELPYTHQEDVIYGRKFGTALTMDIFKPKRETNGAAIVLAVSGGFFSSHEAINPALVLPLTNRGYTVFTVVHGSQPRYTVPEIVEDMNRAVRFIRHHAADYGIDTNRIGVTGASAGGHLSLMLGTAGSQGDPNAKDPVDRESSRVQAVACFFPPTDLLNWGKTGKEMIRATDHDPRYRPAFDHRERDEKTALWVPITDPEKLRQIAHKISPIDHVTPDDPPTLMIHGDADPVVPVQQAQTMAEALKKAGVETKLIIKEGAGHGWLSILNDVNQFVDWFDAHLKKADASGDVKSP